MYYWYIDLIFKILIFTVYYARECNFCGKVLVHFLYCTYQFLCLFQDVAMVLQVISTCMNNYRNYKFFTYGLLNVVSQVLHWYPRMRSKFNWIATRYIPSIRNSYMIVHTWKFANKLGGEFIHYLNVFPNFSVFPFFVRRRRFIFTVCFSFSIISFKLLEFSWRL